MNPPWLLVRRAPPDRRFRWSLLGSIWVHLALVLVANCQGTVGDPGAESPVDSGPITLFQLEAVSGERGAGEVAGADGAAERSAEGRAVATAVEHLSVPTPPHPASHLSSPLRTTGVAEPGSATAELAEVDHGDPTPTGVPVDAESDTAAYASDDGLVALDLQRAPPAVVPDAGREVPAGPDPERDLREARDSEVREFEPEETEEESPDPDPAESGIRWQHYADTTGLEPALEADPEALSISSANVRAEETSRAVVTAREQGPSMPRDEVLRSRPSDPSLAVRPGEQRDLMGDRPDERRASLAADGQGARVGRRGRRVGSGARTAGGDRVAGGPAARPGSGGGRPPSLPGRGGASGGGAASSEGYETAFTGRWPAPSRGPDWWSPTVFRVLARSEPSPPPAPAVVAVRAPPQETSVVRRRQPPSPTIAKDVAISERSGDRADRGGTDAADEDEAPPEDQEAPQPGTADEADLEVVDPIDELRHSLGWGGLDRAELAPRKDSPGVEASTGSVDRSPQTVLGDDVPITGVVFLTARDTELGRYRNQIDEVIKSRWYARDIDVHQRAQAIQGTTTVEFRVRTSGRVCDVSLVRSSGVLELDRIAVDAIPRRLPRFPRVLRKSLDGDSVVQRVSFRYRNPVVVQEGGW